MGSGYGIKCTDCDYEISISEGVGMQHSPNAVFYGRCDDPSQNWSIAFPDGYCEEGRPLLFEIIKDEAIKSKASEFLKNGAKPDEYYGYELYSCPECSLLDNLFYFKLKSKSETYEPEYHCKKCNSISLRAKIKFNKAGECKIAYFNKRKLDLICPECGCNKLVDNGEFILWD